MFPFDQLRLRKPASKAARILTEDALRGRARRHMLWLLLAGLLLIFADLGNSFLLQDVRIAEKDGQYYLIRPPAGSPAGHISLLASVDTEEGTYRQTMQVILVPAEDVRAADHNMPASESAQDADASAQPAEIAGELRHMQQHLNEDTSRRKVSLPLQLGDGTPVHWSLRRQTNTFALLTLTILGLALIYRTRLTPLRRLQRKQQEEVLLALPGFLDQLVLLLGAGLVLTRAFRQTIAEQTQYHNTSNNYFYEGMGKICSSLENTNASLHLELAAFARESGVNELLRISNIISDNLSKGTALSGKLQRESASLWAARKARCEQQGRLAETKMTLPLVIFLCVLLVITVCPALMSL